MIIISLIIIIIIIAQNPTYSDKRTKKNLHKWINKDVTTIKIIFNDFALLYSAVDEWVQYFLLALSLAVLFIVSVWCEITFRKQTGIFKIL